MKQDKEKRSRYHAWIEIKFREMFGAIEFRLIC